MLVSLLAVLALLSPQSMLASPTGSIVGPISLVEVCQYQPNPTWWSKCEPGPFTLAGPPRELLMTRVFVAAPTVITITFHRLDGTVLYEYSSDQRALRPLALAGQAELANRWSWAVAWVGTFSWEVITPGLYTVDVQAAGGVTHTSFEVVP